MGERFTIYLLINLFIIGSLWIEPKGLTYIRKVLCIWTTYLVPNQLLFFSFLHQAQQVSSGGNLYGRIYASHTRDPRIDWRSGAHL